MDGRDILTLPKQQFKNMDIKEETQKLGGNPTVRYAPLMLGLLIFLFSQTVLTWKSSSARDASGAVEAVQLKISMLEKKAADAEDSDDKKEYREQAKELQEDKLEEARIEAAEESVDAKQGVWFWSMVRMMGVSVMALGFIAIGVFGLAHEKIGALIALALMLTKF